MPSQASIDLDELAAMFRRAARNGACPNVPILREYPFLRSVEWVQTAVEIDTPIDRQQFLIQQEMRRSLERVQEFLPHFIRAKSFVAKAGLPGFDQGKVDALVRLDTAIADALPAFPALSPGVRAANWHTAASLVALFATLAWKRAGRRALGKNSTSPLVKFIHEFLALAGVHVEPSAIAVAFQRGQIRDFAKTPTNQRPPL
jgi:hypothetical protein